jgi:hypothetical protein
VNVSEPNREDKHMNAPATTTKNPEWGFYGSMGSSAEAAWPIAIASIAKHHKGAN